MIYFPFSGVKLKEKSLFTPAPPHQVQNFFFSFSGPGTEQDTGQHRGDCTGMLPLKSMLMSLACPVEWSVLEH